MHEESTPNRIFKFGLWLASKNHSQILWIETSATQHFLSFVMR